MAYKYVEGDLRQKIKFAWLPRKVGCRSIWLRKYMVIQKYTYYYAEPKYWVNRGLSWVTIRETLEYWQ